MPNQLFFYAIFGILLKFKCYNSYKNRREKSLIHYLYNFEIV